MTDETQVIDVDEEARKAAEKTRKQQEQTIEAAATVAIAQAVLSMPQYKGATLVKIDAGVGTYNWRGETKIRLKDGTVLTIGIDATLPGANEEE
jgi:sortase (surface protein transpeptidase)